MGSLFGRFFLALIRFLETSWGKWVFVLLTPVFGFFGVMVGLINQAVGYLNAMINSSVSALGTAQNYNAGVAFGIANHFVPLDLVFNYCALGVEIMLVALVYRAIKSWVPTLS